MAAGMGASIAVGSRLPVATTIYVFVAVALLRITLEARRP
jgi:hypothetical protein